MTIASGFAGYNFGLFIILSLITRGLRFFIVAGLLYIYGEPIRDFIERRLGTVTLANVRGDRVRICDRDDMSYSAVTTHDGQTDLSLSTAALVLAGVSFATLAAAWIVPVLWLSSLLALPGGADSLLRGRPGRASRGFSREQNGPRLAAFIVAALALGFLYNAGLSIYHAGAEWHFWPGPDTCTGNGDLLKPGSLSKALQHNQAVRCDEAAIRIFGVSLAGYNVLISGALAALGRLRRVAKF